MYNTKIAELFSEIADMLSLDENISRFEVLAYRKAALTLESLSDDVAHIYKKHGIAGLMELPGIGKSTAGSIKEYLETGKMQKYENLKKTYPIDFKNLTRIQGVGPKRVLRLYQKLGVKNIEDLKKAAAAHKISRLEGFGTRSEEEIVKGLQQFESSKGRMPLGYALPEAEAIITKLRESGLVERAEIAGSSRRMRETVGDLDILVTSKKSGPVAEFVNKLEEVERTIVSGPTKITVLLKIGLTCDVRILEDKSFGAAMQYFTGNKEHNVKLREIAIRHGYKLNEYGLFDNSGKNVAAKTEGEIYKKLGMDCPEPEMREDRGEIDLALKRKLPGLVQIGDIKGDLHVHTNHSDGVEPLEAMVAMAKRLGRQYVGITDHSKSEYAAHGMDDAKFVKHLEGIDKANEKAEGIRILKSSEIDILRDGSLDLEKKTMELMDYRLCSIHTNLNMPREEMTKRIIKAFDSGYVDIWAHPTDRIINSRPPINADLDRVFEAAERDNVILEIDSYPDRLDLNDENIIKARNYRVKFSIDTDSHRSENMLFMRYGIGTAKRGWLTKYDVVNTLPTEKLLRLFHKF